MTQSYISAAIGFGIGIVVASFIFLFRWIKITKSQKSLEGFLETEKLIRERLQKDNVWLHELKETTQTEYELKILELQAVIKRMDEDILLLQRSNEETEELLKAGEPVIHGLKLKLIEANNTISRFKAQVAVK